MSENEEKSLDPLLALSSELPELPEPVAFLHNIPRNALFSADQMRAYANGHATYWYEMHRSLLTAYNELRAANARADGVEELVGALQDLLGWMPHGPWFTDAPRAAFSRAHAAIAKFKPTPGSEVGS